MPLCKGKVLEHQSSFHETSIPMGSSVRALPPGIWALGLSAMFMDMSSELVHSLLPIFMASVLGASMVTIGFLEGVAEATAAITKIFSGVLSDYLGKRKFLVVLGYGLAAIYQAGVSACPIHLLGFRRALH